MVAVGLGTTGSGWETKKGITIVLTGLAGVSSREYIFHIW